ncbi:MAG: diguanylate cyclase, partial [Clostridia bacterium]|nr:diguanylate cyclase [Clostridia bacterium]
RAEIDRRCDALRLASQSAFEKYGCGTSVSIGVAHTDGGSLDIDSLIYESDAGMYAEKKRHHGA